jgi:hypothetical protein
MGKEFNFIQLPGVEYRNRQVDSFDEIKLGKTLKRKGNQLARKLQGLTEHIDKSHRDFVMWNCYDFERFMIDQPNKQNNNVGLQLQAGDYFIDKISFSSEVNGYQLIVIGGSNLSGEFQSVESEMRILFDKTEGKLSFNDIVFLSKFGHGLGDFGKVDLKLQSKLKVLNIANSAANLFLQMDMLPQK